MTARIVVRRYAEHVRRAFALLLPLALVACSGSRAAAPLKPAPAPSKTPTRTRVVAARAPAVKMTSGLDSTAGVLVSWCDGRCDRDARAQPERILKGQENGLLVFQASSAPQIAKIEIRDRAGRTIRSGDLAAGTTMAYLGQLGRGRFTVILVARFASREGRWVFGLQGPLGG